MNIRITYQRDLADLRSVLDGTQLFPSEMLPNMVADFLGPQTSEELWLTCERDGKAIGFCYAVPEALADGTWNMLALAVLPEFQGTGSGSALVAALETRLRADGHRVLIADTSGTQEFAKTRAFYAKNGYDEEARIRDFWASGDDKVTFRKALA